MEVRQEGRRARGQEGRKVRSKLKGSKYKL
jgi:hypothetical protein